MADRKDSAYWEERVAKKTWQTYNSLEERNRLLLEMYQDAGRGISDELYRIAEKINKGQGVTLTDMHKFNRLSGLQKNFEGILLELGEQTETFARGNMQDGFGDTYKTASAAISGESYTVPNQKLMDEMLDRPWRGDSFSSRLWKNTSVLAASLNEDLVTGLQQGKTIAEISINLANRMQQGFNVAHRLVRTETMHYLNSSALRSYRDRGITHVQVWVAEDERLCDECAKYHGKIYPIDQVPVLPFHAHCRCTIIPAVDVLNDRQRAAVNRYIGSDSYKINEKLRLKMPLTEEEKQFIKDLDDALDMLPNYEGDVTRSLSFMNTEQRDEFIKVHATGKRVQYKAYTSSTDNGPYDDTGQVEIFILNGGGKDLRIYNQGESEILFKRNTEFEVTGCSQMDGQTVITMEEVR